jgi:uncharacterized membrane protein
MSDRRLTFGLALANALWTIALVAAPLSLAAGTVVGLDGSANHIDHADAWSALPVLARVVYTIGDLNCHQIASRSWELGGNQIPVDVRMFAAFLTANAGFALALVRPARWRLRDAVALHAPRTLQGRLDSSGRRLAALASLWALAVLPALVDVLIQLFTRYESTNRVRFLTGGLSGLIGAFLIGLLVRCLMVEPARRSVASPQDHADG